MVAARKTTNHEEIRQWVEQRGGHPACIKATKDRGPGCQLRIDFPGYSGEDSLEPMTWDEFFEVFDDNELAFLHQDEVDGKESRFSKFISRDAD